MSTRKILAFAGSCRRGSFNVKLVHVAAEGARQAGADVTVVDLKEYPLPLYNQDLESDEGIPEPAMQLKALFREHQGLLISSPEYNSSITPLLKNTIDWVSRPVDGESGLKNFQGKVASLMAASPGALGGLRGLVHVRSILSNIGVIVLPDQVAVSRAADAFNDSGGLNDAKQQEKVEGLGRKLAELLGKLES